jgi:hypothetical protein
MCTVSMVMDHYTDHWKKYVVPSIWVSPPVTQPPLPDTHTIPLTVPTTIQWQPLSSPPTREEFDALKREVEFMKGLLIRAKIYDEETNQRDCETEEKMALVRRIAELVGVDLNDILGKPKA